MAQKDPQVGRQQVLHAGRVAVRIKSYTSSYKGEN